MAINNISFTGQYKKTPNGNYYKKKKTFRNISTMAGVAVGVALAALPVSQNGAMTLALKLFPEKPLKMFAATYGIMAAGIIAVAMIFRGLGAVPDRAVNKKRIAKADHIA